MFSGRSQNTGVTAFGLDTKLESLKLTWQSIDPSANRYRYFVLRIDEDLWGNFYVVRRWGRIGSENLRERYLWPANQAERERWVRHVCRAREDHGYELVAAEG